MLRRTDVEVPGATLAVWTGGDGPRTIVALHAGVTDSRGWHACLKPWHEAGFRTICYDRRGFGATVHTSGPHDPRADLDAVLEATRAPAQVILLGNSMGGRLAMDWTLAHPGRVEALVLIASLPSGTPHEVYVETAAEQAQDALIAAAEEAGDLEEVNRLEARYWLDGTEQPEGRVHGEVRELMLDMNGRALRAEPAGESTAPRDAWSRLAEITAPTLLVAGAHDLAGQNRVIERVAAMLPNARAKTLLGSAHLPSLDAPEELSALVTAFLTTAVGHGGG